jgi:hypothetical protein
MSIVGKGKALKIKEMCTMSDNCFKYRSGNYKVLSSQMHCLHDS